MPDDITNIPSARSQFLEPDGRVNRVWYKFFLNLFTLLGGGSAATVSVEDLQLAPESDPVSIDDIRQLFEQALLGELSPQPVVAEPVPVQPLPQIDLSYMQRQIDELSLSPIAQPSTTTTYTTGSVLFAGSSGAPTQDNSNFFFDDTNNRLAVGTNDTTGGTNAAINAVSTTTTAIKFQGNSTGVKGVLYSDASLIGLIDTTGNNGLIVTPGSNSLDLRTTSSTPRLTVSGSAGDVTVNTGDLTVNTAGKGLKLKEGSNARMGVATLVAGTVTVSNTSVTANTRILTARQGLSGTPGGISIGTVTPGTSFVINSSNATDASVILWVLIEPA